MNGSLIHLLLKILIMKKILFALSCICFFSCKEQNENKVDNGTEAEKPKTEEVKVATPEVSKWMSWADGVDLVAVTDTSFKQPNVIVHVASMVNTPVGSAPSGMVLYQPDAKQPPVVMGFVSTNNTVGGYFGPNIFAGTPFEKAPVLNATIDIKGGKEKATAKVVVGGHTFELEQTNLGMPYLINRAPSAMPPFHQQGVEVKAGKTILKVDGKEVNIIIPPVGITGGPASVYSPNGVYARN